MPSEGQQAERTTSILLSALRLIADDRREEGVRLCREAIRKDPENGDLYFEYGDLLQVLRRYRHAIRAYEKAIALNSYFADDAYYGLAQAHYELGDYEESKRCCMEAMRTCYECNMPRLFLAGIYLTARPRQARKAEALYREAIRNDSQDLEAITKLGLLLESNNKKGEAIKCYGRVVARPPGIAIIYDRYIAIARERLKELVGKGNRRSPHRRPSHQVERR